MSKIKFISITITNFHKEGEDLFATIQFAEEGDLTRYSKLRATSFYVSKKMTIEEIGKMVVSRIKGFDKSKEKEELYRQLKEHFGGNYQEIEETLKQATRVTLGWETSSVFSIPDFKFDKVKDYIEKITLSGERQKGGENAN